MGSSPSRRARLEPLESRTLLSATVTGTPTIANASKLVGPQQDETIVYNPTNPSDMYLVADNAGNSLLTSSSTDGGQTWTPMVRFTGGDGFPAASFNPTAAYDSYGNLFVAYTRADTGGTEVVFSYDNGQTFHVLESLKGVQNDPILATGPGALWLAVTPSKMAGNPASVAQAGAAVYSAKVTGLGRIGTFKPTALTNVASVPESLAVGPAGQVTMAYQYSTELGPSTVYTQTDPDGLGPQRFGPANSSILTNVGTDTAAGPVEVTGISAGASLAYDDSPDAYTGRLYVAYVSADSSSSSGSNIELRYSDDNGATWSAPMQVNDDASGNSHFMPSVAVDPVTGAVAVTWYDSRNDNGVPGTGGTDNTANDDVQVYGAVGTATMGGVNFSPNFVIQPAFSNANDEAVILEGGGGIDSQQLGVHNGLAFYNGHAVTAWADNSNSTGNNADGTLGFFDVNAGSFTVTTTNPPSDTLLGVFGTGHGVYTYTAADGTRVRFQLSKGDGYLFADASGNLVLRASSTTTNSVLTITASRGSRQVSLTDVAVNGSLASIVAPSLNVTGTFAVSGQVKRAVLGSVNAGAFAAGGAIGNMTVGSLTNADVLSGAVPGPVNTFASPNTGQSYAGGSINSLVVRGAITSSFVGAGVNPVDAVFGNGNDTIIGGAASRIGTLRAASADSTSVFEAGAFGKALLPQAVNPATDPRFVVG